MCVGVVEFFYSIFQCSEVKSSGDGLWTARSPFSGLWTAAALRKQANPVVPEDDAESASGQWLGVVEMESGLGGCERGMGELSLAGAGREFRGLMWTRGVEGNPLLPSLEMLWCISCGM